MALLGGRPRLLPVHLEIALRPELGRAVVGRLVVLVVGAIFPRIRAVSTPGTGNRSRYWTPDDPLVP